MPPSWKRVTSGADQVRESPAAAASHPPPRAGMSRSFAGSKPGGRGRVGVRGRVRREGEPTRRRCVLTTNADEVPRRVEDHTPPRAARTPRHVVVVRRERAGHAAPPPAPAPSPGRGRRGAVKDVEPLDRGHPGRLLGARRATEDRAVPPAARGGGGAGEACLEEARLGVDDDGQDREPRGARCRPAAARALAAARTLVSSTRTRVGVRQDRLGAILSSVAGATDGSAGGFRRPPRKIVERDGETREAVLLRVTRPARGELEDGRRGGGGRCRRGARRDGRLPPATRNRSWSASTSARSVVRPVARRPRAARATVARGRRDAISRRAVASPRRAGGSPAAEPRRTPVRQRAAGWTRPGPVLCASTVTSPTMSIQMRPASRRRARACERRVDRAQAGARAERSHHVQPAATSAKPMNAGPAQSSCTSRR